MRLEDLNALGAEAAERKLLRCCGSLQWATMMVAARPFESAEAMTATGDAIWARLDPADWIEAFAAHPRIGERGAGTTDRAGEMGRAGEARRADRENWSQQEQAGIAAAAEDVRTRLAAANREYHARFGYIFIVCATGKTAEEMLEILERRLKNAPESELRVAAEEQRKITRLRLAKLLEYEQAPTT